MGVPIAYQGRGSVLALSTDNQNFTALPQLEKFNHAGADSTLEKITACDSPGNTEYYLPTIIDNKDISFEGPLDPENVALNNAYGWLQSQTELYFKATLKDGSTFTGQCYITKWKLFDVDVRKAVMFSGAITIVGTVAWTAA